MPQAQELKLDSRVDPNVVRQLMATLFDIDGATGTIGPHGEATIKFPSLANAKTPAMSAPDPAGIPFEYMNQILQQGPTGAEPFAIADLVSQMAGREATGKLQGAQGDMMRAQTQLMVPQLQQRILETLLEAQMSETLQKRRGAQADLDAMKTRELGMKLDELDMLAPDERRRAMLEEFGTSDRSKQVAWLMQMLPPDPKLGFDEQMADLLRQATNIVYGRPMTTEQMRFELTEAGMGAMLPGIAQQAIEPEYQKALIKFLGGGAGAEDEEVMDLTDAIREAEKAQKKKKQ